LGEGLAYAVTNSVDPSPKKLAPPTPVTPDK